MVAERGKNDGIRGPDFAKHGARRSGAVNTGRTRRPRAKRPPRVEKGKRIIFRLTDEEDERLRGEAGELGVSGYIRSRLFGDDAGDRDALQEIAALHVIGRQLQLLASDPKSEPGAIATSLDEVRAAIGRLAGDAPAIAKGTTMP